MLSRFSKIGDEFYDKFDLTRPLYLPRRRKEMTPLKIERRHSGQAGIALNKRAGAFLSTISAGDFAGKSRPEDRSVPQCRTWD